MKTRNRLFAILLALAMVITYMPGSALAFDEPVQNDPLAGSSAEAPGESTAGSQAETPTDPSAEAPANSPADFPADPSAEAGTDSSADPVSGEEAGRATGSSTEVASGVSKTEEPAGEPDVVLTEETLESNSFTPEAEAADNDDLLWGFLNKELTGGDAVPNGGALKMRKAPRGNQLEGYDKAAYDNLKAQITAFTDPKTVSTRTNAVFNIDLSVILGHSLERINVGTETPGYKISRDELAAINNVINNDQMLPILLLDMPYELFWFDKSVDSAITVSANPREIYSNGDPDYLIFLTSPSLQYTFKVSADYSASGTRGTTKFDLEKINAVKATVNNAGAIIENASGMSDFEKLVAYKNEICRLASYNNDAAGDNRPPYGDPWQMIYVFDDDPNTKVVCEGYSKAFQYLCDHSDLYDTDCYTATGIMGSSTVSGPHMWNILHMDDGHNYIADITNSDAAGMSYISGNDPDGSFLFLNGFDSGDLTNGYTYSSGGDSYYYIYDEQTKGLYSAEELTLSSADYTGKLVYNLRLALEKPVCGTVVEAMGPAPMIEVKSDRFTTVEAYWEKDGSPFGGTIAGGETYTANIVASIPEDKLSEHSYDSNIIVKVNGAVVTPISKDGSRVTFKADIVAGHDLKAHPAVAATTAKAGSKAYWSCNVCGKFFSDAAGTKEIAENSWVIPKLISISKATVTGVANKVYTGKAIAQKPVVKLGGKTLVSGKDYKLTYKNNKNVGKATVTITGIGAYGAYVSKTFNINPKGTSISKLTAAKKGFTASWKKQATQTTGYELQYALNSKFTSGRKTLAITKNSIVSKKVAKLKAKKKYYVRVRAYKTVSGKKYYSAWSAVKAVTTKK